MNGPELYVEHVLLCSSTMDLARERAAQHPEPFGLITATEQTAGRGRRGNSWKTPQDGFIGTFWIRSTLQTAQLSGLSLAVGVLVIQVLKALGVAAWLKWPNDIVTIDCRKVGGILIEMGASSLDGEQVVFVGVGINVRAPTELALSAAGAQDLLDATGCTRKGKSWLSANFGQRFRDRLVERLPKFWEDFARDGLSAFVSPWRDRCINIGKDVEFTRGQMRERGLFLDVGAAGEALIEVKGIVERFFSGEIHTVRELR